MIQSMTGYGKHEFTFQNRQITIEIKSLNSKSLDLNVKLPSMYRSLEMEIRKQLGANLKRGKIECLVYYDTIEIERQTTFNEALLKDYYQDLSKISSELNISSQDWLATLLRLPDVTQSEKQQLNEGEDAALLNGLNSCIDQFNEFRIEEGKALALDFEQALDRIKSSMNGVETILPVRKHAVVDKLNKALQDLKAEKDENRFEAELIYYLEKYDVNEELQRLEQHLKYFRETMELKDSQGKKLGFIAQEIGREINTLGSKANNAEMQRIVVGMKDDLEKIKEQVLNTL